ncbi:MAG TPA: NAD(P)H-hydrate epimerase, partial [Firmicutes bacterium]|nr:NAD(P)H-hydrate epimerase [Bacillota bacterium]
MKIVSGEKMGEIDRLAMSRYGIPGLILMENAGLQVVSLVKKIRPERKRGKIVVFCGKGNNGGDGFVIARHLWRQGYNVETWAAGALSDYKGDAAVNYNILLKQGYNVNRFDEKSPVAIIKDLKADDLIVDALLGTGIQRQVTGLLAEIITAINHSPAEIVSVDIPSGIS